MTGTSASLRKYMIDAHDACAWIQTRDMLGSICGVRLLARYR